MINEKKHNIEYSSFLKGKTVALVGPASSVKIEDNANKIDSCDIVVRINQGLNQISTSKEFIGTKTDVLYNSLDFDNLSGGNLFSMDLQGIKFICCPYAISENTFQKIIFLKYNDKVLYENYKIRFIEEELYSSIKEKTNSRINSGLGTIVDILSFEVKSLYITGIDFYRSYYCNDYCLSRNRKQDKESLEEELEFKIYNDNEHHNPDRQYRFFKDLVKQDPRIQIDSFMNKIINDHRYDNWDTIPRG